MDQNNEISTQSKLLEVATKQFALHGFEKTTTRAIVQEANTSIASLFFHYESKEKLYKTIISNIIDSYIAFQQKIFDEINAIEEQGLLTPDRTWNYITGLIDLVIEWNFSPEHFYDALLFKREAIFPSQTFIHAADNISIMYGYLQKLFQVYANSDDRLWSRNAVRITMGTVYAFSNYHPSSEFDLRHSPSEAGISAAVKSDMKNSILTAIRAILNNGSVEKYPL